MVCALPSSLDDFAPGTNRSAHARQLADDLHEQIGATRETIDRGRALLAEAHVRLKRARIVRPAWPSPQNRYLLIPEQPIRPDFNPAQAVPIEATKVIAGSPKAIARLTVEWPTPVPIESLTWSETAVLRLLDARLSKQEIAAVLRISSEAVQRQTCRIYRRLGIRTRASSGGSRNAPNS